MNNNYFKKTFGTPSKWGQARPNWARAHRAPPRRATPPKAKSRNSPKARASSVNNFNRAARNRQTLNLYVQKWVGINSRGNKLVKIGLYVHPNKNPGLNKAKLNRLVRLYTELLNAKKRGGVPSSRR